MPALSCCRTKRNTAQPHGDWPYLLVFQLCRAVSALASLFTRLVSLLCLFFVVSSCVTHFFTCFALCPPHSALVVLSRPLSYSSCCVTFLLHTHLHISFCACRYPHHSPLGLTLFSQFLFVSSVPRVALPSSCSLSSAPLPVSISSLYVLLVFSLSVAFSSCYWQSLHTACPSRTRPMHVSPHHSLPLC